MIGGDQNEATAHRCRLIRFVVEGNGHGDRTRFAARLGVEPARWSNAECGYPLSIGLAFLLIEVFPGLSLDWLYFGKTDGLSVKMFKLLDAGRISNEDKSLQRE